MTTDAAPAKARSGLSLAVGDALATAFFMFVSSTFEEVLQSMLVGSCRDHRAILHQIRLCR